MIPLMGPREGGRCKTMLQTICANFIPLSKKKNNILSKKWTPHSLNMHKHELVNPQKLSLSPTRKTLVEDVGNRTGNCCNYA